MNGVIMAPCNVCMQQKLYQANGDIFNSDGDAVRGIGTASVMLYPNGIAEIHYQVKISTAGTREDYFNLGLNRDLLTKRNENIPIITPTDGGKILYYTADGTINAEMTGYAGTHQTHQQFWKPARVYFEDGATGAWPAHMFGLGIRIDGVCYGSY